MLERTLFAAISCVAFVGLTACTGADDSGHDGSTTTSASTTATTATTGSGGGGSTTTGAGGSGGAGGSTDSGGAGGTGGSGGAGGAPSGYKSGQVFVASGVYTADTPHSYEVMAGFATSLDGTLGVYTSKPIGPCVVKSYSTPFTQGTFTKVSAGTVTVNGGIKPISLVPDATSSYAKVQDLTMDLFSGGETITIDAAGADVPAFSASAIAPGEVDLTSPPEPPNNASLPVDRTADLVFSWKDGGPGDIFVRFRDGTSTEVACSFPSASGTGTVPKEALAALGAGSSGTFNVLPGSIQVVTAGDWRVEVWVFSSLTWNGVLNPQTWFYQATN